MKSGGCSICGFLDENLLRFLHFDHLNPVDKIANVSTMVYDEKCSMNDVIKECQKTRVLCGHCHIIHTANQRAKGIL